MLQNNKKIAIIGAGPAGLLLAINLKKLNKNVDVTIFEEHEDVLKNKKCTGLFSKKTYEMLNEYVDMKKVMEKKIKKAIIYFQNEKKDKYLKNKKENNFIKNDFFIVLNKTFNSCNRQKLDELLFLKAKKMNVKFIFKKHFPNIDYSNFNVIVGADGPNSKVADHFSFEKIEKFVKVAQTKICDDEKIKKQNNQTIINQASTNQPIINQSIIDQPSTNQPIINQPIINQLTNDQPIYVFLNKKFKGFFGWSVPSFENEYKIGYGSFLKVKKQEIYEIINFRKKLKEKANSINETQIKNQNENQIKNQNENQIKIMQNLKKEQTDLEIEYSIIPMKKRKTIQKKINDKKIFLIGDSAGQIKFLSGGGIYYILKTSKILAKTIIKDEFNYQKNVEKKLFKDFLMQDIAKSVFDFKYFFLFSYLTKPIFQPFLNLFFDIDSIF